jgi:transcriptional regulator with XRE-family HTH domain
MNLGARALERVITKRDLMQKEVARESGVPESKISRILSGKALPNLAEAIALRTWGAIDPALWEQEEPKTEGDNEPAKVAEG